MAINIYKSRTSLPHRIKYYEHKYFNDDTALKETKKVKGIFYARKHGTPSKFSYVTANNVKTIKSETQLFIEDIIDDLEIDDFVLFEGKKWIVVLIEEVPEVKSNTQIAYDAKVITIRS